MKNIRTLITFVSVCTLCIAQAIEPTIVWEGGLKYWIKSSISGDTTAVLLHKSAEVSIMSQYHQSIYLLSDANYADLPPRLILPDSIAYNGRKFPVSSISDKAFSGTNLHEIVLPKTISSIGQQSFAQCPNCTSIIVAESEQDVVIGSLFGLYSGHEYTYTTTKKLQIPHMVNFLGSIDEDYTYIYYRPLSCVNYLFSEAPVSMMSLLELEKNITYNSHVKYYGAMTHDESLHYAGLSDAYTQVRGFGLWGADVATTDVEDYVDVPIELNRLDPITSVSFELVMPSNIHLTDNNLTLNSERIADHYLTINENHITIMSPTQTRLNGCDSTLLTLRLPMADYDIVLTDITISDIDGDIFTQDNDTIRIGNGNNQEARHYDITNVNRTINQMLGKDRTGSFDAKDITFQMVAVEGGTFMMGDPNYQNRDNPSYFRPHEVTLDNYLIANTEVTTELWNAVMNDNQDGYPKVAIRKKWDDWNVFIAKLNELTGLSFRMPSEAEWEYAARGGNNTQNYDYSGCDYSEIDQYGWVYRTKNYQDDITRYSYPVGLLLPNELGLYDMSGNVEEVCQDWYDPYPTNPQNNPSGPASGKYHVFRGGNCYSDSFVQTARVYDRCNPDPYGLIQESWPHGLRLAMNGSTLPSDKSCDYNGDGQVDIADVNYVINKMLKK